MKIFGRISKKAVLISTTVIAVSVIATAGITVALQTKTAEQSNNNTVASVETVHKQSAVEADTTVKSDESTVVDTTPQPQSSIAPTSTPAASPTPSADDEQLAKLCDGLNRLVDHLNEAYTIQHIPASSINQKILHDLTASGSQWYSVGIYYQKCVDAGKTQAL